MALKLDWRYFAVAVAIIAFFVIKTGPDSTSSDQLWFILLPALVVCFIVTLFGMNGYKKATAWNVLVLGDHKIVSQFERYCKPELAKIYKDKNVNVFCAKKGAIENQPFDAVVLAVDLASLKNTGNSFDDILEAERKAVEHFGGAVVRHIILIAGYERKFGVPHDIPAYVNKYAPDNIRQLFEKYRQTWLGMCIDNPTNGGHIERFQGKVDEVAAVNCGPIKHRIILLGGRDSNKGNVGNMILNEDVFGDTEQDECVAAERVIAGKRVLVVNTPAVQTETVDNRDCKNQKKISESLLLTSPGPRVFVMVVNEEDENTDDISACFKVFENRFGTTSYSNLIVVMKRDKRSESIPEPLRSRREKLGDRLVFDHGDCYPKKGNYIQKEILSIIKKPSVETTKKELSLVLIGPSRLGKSHTAGNLLGLSEGDNIFSTECQSKPSCCSVAMRSIDNYILVIADTPSLGTHVISNEEVFREIEKCAFFPDKRPRPIAIVLRCDRPLHLHEMESVELIETTLLPDWKTCMLLFTHKDNTQLRNEAGSVVQKEDLENIDSDKGHLKTLLSNCHWRCVAYDNGEKTRSKKVQQNRAVYSLVNQVVNPDPHDWSTAWNVLVLGDHHMVNLFERYVIPELVKIYRDRKVNMYRSKNGTIEEQPFDAVILAVDFASLNITTSNALEQIRDAERKAFDHFGEAVYRHIICIVGYERKLPVPDDIPDYINKYASESAHKLLEKYKRTRMVMCLDKHENTDQIQRLKHQIDEITAENCGPIKHRIILLGGRDSNKTNIGNLIFNEDVFEDTKSDECVAVERVVAGKRVMIVNTPAVNSETVGNPDSENQKKISESLLLTSPGPRVFVMVINAVELDTDISACFKVFENRFGTTSYSHLIVVLKKDQRENNMSGLLRSRLAKLEGQLIFDHGEQTDRTKIQQQILSMIKKKNVETTKKELSLVLIGPSRLGKSHTAGNLLGLCEGDNIFSTERQSKPSCASVAMRSIDTYNLVIIDTPSLGTHVMSNEEVFREIEKCAFFPDKRPRPLAVVLRCDRPLHPHELECLQFLIERMLSTSLRQTIVLFTRKHFMELQKEEEMKDFRGYLKRTGEGRGPLQSFLFACHWRCVAYENLEEKAPRRINQNNVVFALVEQVMSTDRLLQLVLVGCTGSGKSSSANTIMSSPNGVFDASYSQLSNTEECHIEEFEVEGRKVRLIDTPGLFDDRPQWDDKTTMMELCKCVLYTLPGPHAFLFLINAQSRLTSDAHKTLTLLMDIFGKEILRHMVVIITRLDALKEDNMTVSDYIVQIKGQRTDIGKQFFNRSGEYVAFDNREGKQTGNEARELIEAVERTIAANEHCHFRNDTYDQIVERLEVYKFDDRFKFEEHPAKFASAVAVVAGAGLTATGFGAPVAAVIAAFSATASYFFTKKK